MENFNSLIYEKDGIYCLNDIAEKLILSKNVKEYMLKIKDKKVINGNYYITKDKMIEILGKSKSVKAHQYLQYTENLSNKLTENKKIISDKEIEHVYEDNITTKKELQLKALNRQFIDFGSNEIIYANKRILFFDFNNQIYFKAKDICDLLEYSISNTNKTIINHIDKEDIFTFEDYTLERNGGSKTEPLFRDDKTIKHLNKLKSSMESKTNKIIEPHTIFINESGLYSLILSSKMPKAKEFKHWVTSDVLVSIRKNGSYSAIQNGEIYDDHKIREFNDKSCIYLLKVKGNIFKYGESDCINNRLCKHKKNLDFDEIIKIFEVPNKTIARDIEDSIKKFTKNAKINIIYGNSIEFFEINHIYTLDRVLIEIKILINEHLDEHNKKLKNTDLTSLESIEKIKIHQYKLKKEIEDKKLEQIKYTTEVDIMKEKTRQMELQLELEKLKLNNQSKSTCIKNDKAINEKNIRPKVKKCSTCSTMIAEKSSHCSPCVNKLRSEKSIEKTNRPSLDQLEKDLETLGTIVKVGCKYGVSDNAIRKWIKRYKKN